MIECVKEKTIRCIMSNVVRDSDPLFAPACITIYDNMMYVIDEIGHKVCVFDLSLEKRAEYGSYGDRHGQLRYPSSLCFDDLGRVYVADKWNHRVQVFDQQFTFIKEYGAYGTGEGEFNEPAGVAWNEGILYVAERSSGRLQGFDKDGQVVHVFESNAPLHRFYESPSFKGNKHYTRWLTNTSRFYSMYDQFNECGFKVGVLEYPEEIMTANDKELIVIDKVSGIGVRFSNDLKYEGCVQINSRSSLNMCLINCCCSDDKGSMWFGSDREGSVIRLKGAAEDVFTLQDTRIGSIAVQGEHLYVADFWNGAMYKYSLQGQ